MKSAEFIAQVVAIITQPPEGDELARAGPTGDPKVQRTNAPMKLRGTQRRNGHGIELLFRFASF